MDLDDGSGTQARFEVYTASLATVLGHADRVRPFADYCIGLLSAEGRKSVEPLAAVTAPERTAAQHRLIRPWRLGDKVQQRLVFSRGSLPRGHRRQRFDTLAALR